MSEKIRDYQLKPLKKFYRPHFSPKFNSYETDYAIGNFSINNERILKFYLFVININSKFLFAQPLKNNTHPTIRITKFLIKDINDHLKSLNPDFKIDNIRSEKNNS
jgi:hypothetical protein